MSRRIQLSLQSWSWILTLTVFLLFFLAGMTTRWIAQPATSSRSKASHRPDVPAETGTSHSKTSLRNKQAAPTGHFDISERDRFADCALANFYATHPDLAMKMPTVLEGVLRVKLANLAQTQIEAGNRAVASRIEACLQPGQRLAEVEAEQ